MTTVGGSKVDSTEESWPCKARRALQWVAYAAPIALFALEGWRHRFETDDGFIYYRVVHQIVAGNGPVFNTGHRVEAFTSPLWVAVLSIADLLTPFRLEWIATVLGIVLSVAGLTLAVSGSARLARLSSPHSFLLPAGALVVTALLPMWFWETGGLEMGLVFAWLGASAWALARWAATSPCRIPLWAAVLLGLGWVVRPELILVSFVFVVAVLVGQYRIDRWTGRLRFVLAAAAVPVVYQVFRMGYYGLLVSNTAIAKEGSRLRIGQGWLYLLDFVKPYALWLPVVLLLAGGYLPLAVQLWRSGRRRAVLVLGAFVAASLVIVVGVVGNGGDYMHGRLLVPAVFTLCSPIAVIPARRRYLAVGAVGVWAILAFAVLRPPQLRSPDGFGPAPTLFVLPTYGIAKITLREYYEPALIRPWYRGPGIYVQSKANKTQFKKVNVAPAHDMPLPAVASIDIGARPYAFLDTYILDRRGLADPIAAHLELQVRGYPGHEKTLPGAWIDAMMTDRKSKPSVAFQVEESSTTPGGSSPFAVQVRYARRALQCPALRGLQRSTTASLSPATFLSNVVHSFSRTTLRVPSDPVAAYEELCPPEK